MTDGCDGTWLDVKDPKGVKGGGVNAWVDAVVGKRSEERPEEVQI